MENKIMTYRPEMAFEVSWEVCNKVGGIHTVIASKTPEMLKRFGEQYIVVGPDIWREERDNPEFLEDKALFKGWKEQLSIDGINVRTGHWAIEGKPIAILVDFTSLFTSKDQIFSAAWESWNLDSLSGGWDYVEAALFGYASGAVINSFVRYYQNAKSIAHFHEWMTGMGVLYLDKNAPQIATIFTTHATVVGRSIAGNGMPLYSKLKEYNGDDMANRLGVKAKHSLEKKAAKFADCFTTVSDITATECSQFLECQPDFVTPNGFDPLLVPDQEGLSAQKKVSREKLLALAKAITGHEYANDSLIIGTSGRYEFRNKGLDLFIDGLAHVNKSTSKKQILAFVMVPANHYGPRQSVLSRLKGSNEELQGSPYLSHNLHDSDKDPVIMQLEKLGLKNTKDDQVHVFFIPAYLNGDDKLMGLTYYETLMGLDLSVFPSFYEPWGYTPLESLAFGVPTFTSNLAGFGLWIESYAPKAVNNGIYILDRQNISYEEGVRSLSDKISKLAQYSENELNELRNMAKELAKIALWEDFISYYEKAFEKAIESSGMEITQPEMYTSPNFTLESHESPEINEPNWSSISVESLLPSELSGLSDLAKNLWWTWNYRAEELFDRIDPELWAELEHNPVKLLKKVPYDRLKSLVSDQDFQRHFQEVLTDFKKYVETPPDSNLQDIAYFSMEYGFHSSLKIYSGGLGILAGDYLKEASDRRYPLVGVGLLYRYGYFKQILNGNGEQLSENMREEFSDLAVEVVLDEGNLPLKVKVAFPGRLVHAKVWKAKIGRISLFLLDTDIDENSADDRGLTANLYGGDEEYRLKQEMLLGIGGIRTLNALKLTPSVFHCNEGHAAFIGFERIRNLMEEKKFTFQESKEIVRSSTLFTTHTPVPAGHDAFDEHMIRKYMGHYPARLNLDWDKFMGLGRINSTHTHEKFSMSHLAAHLSQEINGVSKLHGDVTKGMFAPLWKGYYPEELHIGYVTNGVHYQTWTAKEWQELYAKRFGPDFFHNLSDPNYWKAIHDVPDTEVWDTKQALKRKLFTYLEERIRRNSIKRYDPPQQAIDVLDRLNPKYLTIGFARRFATYKRAQLLFKDLDRLSEIVNNSDRPVQFLFAGKAHPRDKAGQDLIKFIVDISKRPEFTGRIVFLENYDMNLARHLVQGVDIWLNTPTRPLEASGTSGMKAVMNGAMNFSVLDGWWCEGYKKGAGWALAEERTYSDQGFQDDLDGATLYSILENEIVPSYYNIDQNGIPQAWVSHMKRTIAEIAPLFTTKRMIDDYQERFYKVLGARASDMKAANYHLAREITRWKNKIAEFWQDIHVNSILNNEQANTSIHLGEEYQIEVELEVGRLTSKDVALELVVVEQKGGEMEFVFARDFIISKEEGSVITYKMAMIPTQPGAFKYGIRAYPIHEKLPNRQDLGILTWL